MLLSRNLLPPEREDAFTSVAITAYIDTRITLEFELLEPISAALKYIIALTIASSVGLVVISDHQLAH